MQQRIEERGQVFVTRHVVRLLPLDLLQKAGNFTCFLPSGSARGVSQDQGVDLHVRPPQLVKRRVVLACTLQGREIGRGGDESDVAAALVRNG